MELGGLGGEGGALSPSTGGFRGQSSLKKVFSL